MTGFKMKIFKTKDTEQLPTMIESCEAPVYLVMNDGKEVALRSSQDALALFRYYWGSEGCEEVQLKFTAPQDAKKALDYSFGW